MFRNAEQKATIQTNGVIQQEAVSVQVKNEDLYSEKNVLW